MTVTLHIPEHEGDFVYSMAGSRDKWEEYFVDEGDGSVVTKLLKCMMDDLAEKFGKTYDQWELEKELKCR